MKDYTTLQAIWFVLICVLWIGYFVLEGFDFGVGMLIRAVGRDRAERRAVLHSIGPVWDGNEVWLLVAGGATFAAFPQWYATLFSGFYLALFLILVALIVRGVVFEFWGKGDTDGWQERWEWALVDQQLPGGAAVGRRLGQHRRRRADRRRRGVHRHAVHAAQALRAGRRRGDADAVPRARGAVPQPPDDGRGRAAGAGDRRARDADRRGRGRSASSSGRWRGRTRSRSPRRSARSGPPRS